jgi:CHAT domain-containing protein
MLAFRTEAAMFESGLVMAGANVTGDDSQSAYLTADEISSFDLSGTELVFLSACDTGLVDTPTGAEVYGLRRAFQLAGAESVIMTMWRIQPAQASEIVEKFYQAWLSGVDKHSALILAQQKVRQNNPAPYYWGAFVMIGH